MQNDPLEAFCTTTDPVVVERDSEGMRGASKRVMQLALLDCTMLLCPSAPAAAPLSHSNKGAQYLQLF